MVARITGKSFDIGCVAHYKLSEDCQDISGNGNHATSALNKAILNYYKFNNNGNDSGTSASNITWSGTPEYTVGKLNQSAIFRSDTKHDARQGALATVSKITLQVGMSFTWWQKNYTFSSTHVDAAAYRNDYNGAFVYSARTYDSNISLKNSRIEFQDYDGKNELVDSDQTTDWSTGLNSTITLNTTTKLEGTGAVNCIKGETNNGFVMDASFTTKNMSDSNSKVWIDFYIKDTSMLNKLRSTTAFQLYLQGGGWNVWTVDRSEVQVGWNTIELNVGTPDSQEGGGATLTAINLLRFRAWTTNTSDLIQEGELIVDSISWANTGKTYYVANTVELNTWDFWGMVFDSDFTYVYKNGQLIGTTATLWLNKICIDQFGRGYGGMYFDGELDEVKVHNRKLSSGEILSLYNEGNGTENSNYFPTKIGNGIMLSNSENIACPTNLLNMTEFTYTCWAQTNLPNTNNNINWDLITNAWFQGANGIAFRLQDTGTEQLAFFYGNGNSTWGRKLVTLADNSIDNLHQYAVTFSLLNNEIKLYQDGQQIGTTGTIEGTFNPAQGFTPKIGGVSGSYFNGLLGEFRIHSRVLSADEIGELYNEGNGTYRQLSSFNADVVTSISKPDYEVTISQPEYSSTIDSPLYSSTISSKIYTATISTEMI